MFCVVSNMSFLPLARAALPLARSRLGHNTRPSRETVEYSSVEHWDRSTPRPEPVQPWRGFLWPHRPSLSLYRFPSDHLGQSDHELELVVSHPDRTPGVHVLMEIRLSAHHNRVANNPLAAS